LGFFEIINTVGSAMALQVNYFLVKHGLNVCVIAYVKDEGGNISAMTFVSTFITYCEVLSLFTRFAGTC